MTLSPRKQTALVVALLVSVLLNLVALGFFGAVGSLVLLRREIVREAVADYPPAVRRAFMMEVFENRRALREDFAALREARAALHAALTAETYDRAAVETAGAEVRRRADAVLALLGAMLADTAERVPDDVRRAIPPMGIGMQALRARDAAEAAGEAAPAEAER